MEDTIGYEAYFSTDEWDAMDVGDWEELDVEDLDFEDVGPDGERDEEALHTATIYDASGPVVGEEAGFEIECERCGKVGTAEDRSQAEAIARLHEANPGEVGPAAATSPGEEAEDPEPRAKNPRNHRTVVSPRDGGCFFDVECPECGRVGSVDSAEEAEAVARLHEAFVAVPVDRWAPE